jgi:2-hydroxy-3-keto-5-methylthiopentenyl-1-phosphate phosphatase
LNRAKGKNVVVTDVRFQNEIRYIQDNGGIVIRVKRGMDPVWFPLLEKITLDAERTKFMQFEHIHKSEWDWVGCDFDFTIHNEGTINELRQSVKSALQFVE